jgi:murein L,D-transpeptidase YafK
VRWLLFLLGCATAHADCPGTGVLVDTAARRLSLCENGQETHHYKVSLGHGGLDKHKEGDGRTPLGEYSLAKGRPSSDFHTFLLVGYPTSAERAAGYTGGAIGVHGPARKFRWLGSLAMVSDWTSGCIAVSSDAEIDEIAAWVKEHQVQSIVIRR